MDMLRKYRCQKGLTLLEVMVAVAVASIALVSFITLVLSSIQMEEHARNVTEAIMVADERMKKVERESFPEVGVTSGMIDPANPMGFVYQQSVKETRFEDIRLVEIEVFWDDRKSSLNVTRYLLKK